ncbi:hypothetical protein [Sphingomonas sp. RIT328]|uniref:hypothetical protein n=1 Tax=Sphingomonas sp. RIT328 TaxID=1470591 RepID=UPI00045192C0|nr:hypothetical protein [Sphingomonas sp. RIT328]EZP50006.1 hypothetical protein BW41_03331 [Sphingomonas sp. RIT328]
MLETLTVLPKLIDAFIAGVVEFFYRFVTGVLRIDAAPLRAAVALQARSKALSSRTMLFLSACVCSAARFVTVPNLGLLRREAGMGAVFPLIVVLYVLFDLASLAAAQILGGPASSRRAARSLMRYGFAASLVSTGLVALVLQCFIVAGMIDLQAFRDFAERRGAIGIVALVAGMVLVACASWYQPAVIAMSLSDRRRTSTGRKRGIAIGTGLSAIAFCYLLYGLQIASARVDGTLGGRISARNLVCEMDDGAVRVIGAIFNERINPAAFSRRSLWLRIAPEFARGSRASEAMKVGHFDVALRKLDGDVLLLKPGEAAVFKAQTTLDPARANRIGRRTGAAACMLTPRRFDMPDLFDSAIAEMDILPPSEDAEPAFYGEVPRYDPRRGAMPRLDRRRRSETP